MAKPSIFSKDYERRMKRRKEELFFSYSYNINFFSNNIYQQWYW
ncbi:hypothetical protein JQ035_04155 [Clostridium botulinum]|nr:hypothetical protein [Clostridium botulinum]